MPAIIVGVVVAFILAAFQSGTVAPNRKHKGIDPGPRVTVESEFIELVRGKP